MASSLELSAERLRARLSMESIPASTNEIEPLVEVVGQERAQEAISFGLGIDASGYNIAVAGPRASGRNTAVHALVEKAAAGKPAASDWVYLFNFDDPYRPRAVSLPAGLGDDLQRDLQSLVEMCRTEIPRAFDSESYEESVNRVLEPIGRARERIVEQLQQAAQEQGFAINITPVGFIAVPVGRDGRPMAPETIRTLPAEYREELEARGRNVQDAITEATRELRRLDAQAREAVAELDREVTRYVVGGHLEDWRERYGEYGLGDFFDAVEEDILSNLDQLKRFTEPQIAQLPPHVVAELSEARDQLLRRYTVNLFVTHGDQPAQHAPIVSERQPTYNSLFGRVNYVARYGSLVTDFTQVRPGAIHQANGGYLILQLEDLLTDPRIWPRLKRTLKAREIKVEDATEGMLPISTATLSPEPIPLDIKVILIGQPWTVALLSLFDQDFRDLFKIRAEFEPDHDLDDATIRSYASFVRRTTDENGLVPFTRDALAEIVHFGNRLAGRQDRLTTRYGTIADLCQEASHVARAEGATAATGAHVLAAIAARHRRSSLVPDRLRRMITEGTLHVETSGEVVGQVNGLAVYQIASEPFGTPVRITCRTGLGRRGVVAIEREVERSGAIHTKGVLVLSGYLTGTFGRQRPLAFTASLTFEQSYDEVEGDSASSAELYAILTSLAGVPVRQDIAVTGSVDQFGNIQPVGGVTVKIEGFFDVCKEIALTGTQGVVIPAANIVDLTLRPDVVEAVESGRFHVWAVRRVEEGLELLTGMAAGEPDDSGNYPEGTLFRLVTDALDRMKEAAPAAGEAPARPAPEGKTEPAPPHE